MIEMAQRAEKLFRPIGWSLFDAYTDSTTSCGLCADTQVVKKLIKSTVTERCASKKMRLA